MPNQQPPERSRPAPEGWVLVRAWVGRFAVLATLLGAWVIATPDFSGPDEPAHVLRAAAVAGGDLGSEASPDYDQGVTRVDDIPRSLGLGPAITSCFAFDRNATPCGPPFEADDTRTSAFTTAGNAPPLFYALVGVPLRAQPDARGLLLARLVSAGACAALIATAAIAALRARRRGFLLVGLAVAVTPMACYLGGVINPSGLEIAAGTATWALLLTTVAAPERPPRWVLVALGLSAATFILARALSPAFFALVVAVTIAALGGRVIDRRERRWQMLGAGLGLAVALATIWVVGHDPTSVVPANVIEPATLSRKLVLSVGKTWGSVEEMVAAFGWLDVHYPRGIHQAWLLAASVLVLLAMHLDRSTRARVALGALLLLSWAIPIAIEVRGYDDYGLIVQGRYILPVAVGIPLLSGLMIDRARAAAVVALDSLRRTILVGLLVAHAAAFWFFLRRYTMGADSGVLIPWDVEWSPRLHPWLLMAVVVAASAEWARWLWTWGSAGGAPEGPAPASSGATDVGNRAG